MIVFGSPHPNGCIFQNSMIEFLDWDSPLLDGHPSLQNLVREGWLQAAVDTRFYISASYASFYGAGDTWDEALTDFLEKLFEVLKDQWL